MNYLKSMLAGIAAAIMAIVMLAAVLLGIAHWPIEPAPGSLLTAVIVSPGQLFLAAGIGFAFGFWRSVRKQRHRIGAARLREESPTRGSLACVPDTLGTGL